MNSENVDVVIVGAGPTGLMLAIELALGGATTLVLERLTTPNEAIKAGAFGALAAEALERRGFGPTIDAYEATMAQAMATMMRSAGVAAGPPSLRRIGGHFAGLLLIDQQRQREPDRRLRGVKQQALEQMLGERARVPGLEVRRGHEMLDFQEDADGIEIKACGPAGELKLRCRYLVGCDGGRSLVRKRAGFEFPGTEPTLTGHQAIVELDHPERLLPLGWRHTATGMLAYGPTPGRILTVEFDGPPSDRESPITMEEVQQSLRSVSGADVTVTEMRTATRFTDNARQATEYRRGRILLAGDAAHVHSPFGGQGLNLGLLDAVNLGWKLAAVVRGRSTEDLLDTYTAERHPVAARVLTNTRAQVALMRPDQQTNALRKIITELMDLDEGNRFFGELISGITTRYELAGEHPLVGTFCRNTTVGQGSAETELFALMHRGNGLLIDAGDGSATEIAKSWAPRVQCVRARDRTSLLVRPYGCIAWATDDEDGIGLEATLRRWFGRRRDDSHA